MRYQNLRALQLSAAWPVLVEICLKDKHNQTLESILALV